MELSGHTILITGGGTGIGLAFARKFVELGNEVIIAGRRLAKLEEAKAQSPKLHIIQGDVADVASVQAMAADVKQRFPKLDVLMNNAGVLRMLNLRTATPDLVALTTELDTNVAGTIRTIAALIDLITANKGTIINVSSALAYVPITCAPIYSATKAALHSYTVSLRFQLQDAGVKVVELMPPSVKTDMSSGMPEGVTYMSTDELVAATLPGLKSGAVEIRPGQSNQLHWMSRIAPGFINKQLYDGTKALIPAS